MQTKHILLAVLALLVSAITNAQEYCLNAPIGYAENVTGGKGGTVVTVKTWNDLKSALTKSGKFIIYVDGTMTGTTRIKMSGIKDKTVIGLPGAKFSNKFIPSKKDEVSNTGFLSLSSCSNIIFRNITFEGPGAYDCNGGDNLTVSSSSNIWVDHCTFKDGIDGNFDINGSSNNISITWCKFQYDIAPMPVSSWVYAEETDHGTDDHRLTNLVGSSDTDGSTPSSRKITFAFCHWANGCKSRMPMSRNSQFHFLNCVWNSADAATDIALGHCVAYVEGCYFTHKKSVIFSDRNLNGLSDINFINSKTTNSSGLPSNQGTVSAPTYSYNAMTADEAFSAVTGSCGAGPTLEIVSATKELFSSCDAGKPNMSYTGKLTQTVAQGSAMETVSFTAGGSATDINCTGTIDGVNIQKSGLVLTLSGTPAASGTLTITATDGVNTVSKTVTLTVKAMASTLTPITVATTWDFSDLGSADIALDATTTPAQNETFIFSNQELVSIPASFNGAALQAEGQYIVRSGTFFQGQKLMFTAGVPGTVTVTFQHTSSSKPERWLTINGTKTDFSTTTSKSWTTSSAIPVAKGDVAISGATSTENNQYLRISKIIFTPNPSTNTTDAFQSSNKTLIAKIGLINLWSDGSKTICK